jgi:hypothetical protein
LKEGKIEEIVVQRQSSDVSGRHKSTAELRLSPRAATQAKSREFVQFGEPGCRVGQFSTRSWVRIQAAPEVRVRKTA